MASDHITQFDSSDFEYNEENDCIGAGGFGEVFKARRKGHEVFVALKLLTAPKRLKKEDSTSFIKEATIMSRLKIHPNIIELLGICNEPQFYALVLEFMQYGSLDNVLIHEYERHEAPLRRWECLVGMGIDVASAMEFLHSQQPPVIHRDLKGANVLVGVDYHCKVCDFGFSKMRGISSITRTSPRREGNPAGTLEFISPERFNQAEVREKAHKGDVYSFGMVLWQIKEKKRPFPGVDRAVIRDLVIAGSRPAIDQSDGCPSQLPNLIVQCWDKQPDERPEFSEIVPKMKRIIDALSAENGSLGRDGGNSTRLPSAASVLDQDVGQSTGTFHSSGQVTADGWPAVADAVGSSSGDGRSEQPVVSAGNPNKEHYWKIKFYWKELINDLTAVDVLDHMLTKIKVMKPHHYEEIKTAPTTKERAVSLLTRLMRQGKEEYDVFLEALKDSQPHLRTLLLQSNPEFDKYMGSDNIALDQSV